MYLAWVVTTSLLLPTFSDALYHLLLLNISYSNKGYLYVHNINIAITYGNWTYLKNIAFKDGSFKEIEG